MKHDLKIKTEYYDNLILGKKKCEIRYNDRDYQVGDILAFTNPHKYDVEYKYFKITHIHSGIGLKDGYVVLSVKEQPNG